MDELIRVYEVPELKRFGTKSAISRWLQSGALEGRKIGGRWFVTEKAVQAFLEGQRPAASKEAGKVRGQGRKGGAV